MAAIAELLGLTVSQLNTILIAGVVLVVGWYVLKTVLKLAVRSFTIGCFTIALGIAALYVFFVVLR